MKRLRRDSRQLVTVHEIDGYLLCSRFCEFYTHVLLTEIPPYLTLYPSGCVLENFRSNIPILEVKFFISQFQTHIHVKIGSAYIRSQNSVRKQPLWADCTLHMSISDEKIAIKSHLSSRVALFTRLYNL